MGPLPNEDSQQELLRGMLFAFVFMLAMWLAGCGGVAGSLTSEAPPSPTPNLSPADVTTLVQTAAQAADPNTMVIAVVDRAGNILAVYRKPSAAALATGN